MRRDSADGRRWASVGTSGDPDARAAGEQAAAAAVGADPRLLIVFAADSYDLEALLGGIRGAVPDVPLIGCSTAGEIEANGASDGRVVVTALGGPGFEVHTAVARHADEDLQAAGAAAAAAATDLRGEHRALLMLSDGLAGDQEEIVRGAYRTVGAAIPLVGGCAGDGMRMQRTHQFHGDEVLTDAVVAAGIASDSPLGIGVEHGWRPVGDRFLVTSSRGNRVTTLDNRPALDVYLDALDAPEIARTDRDAFVQFAMTHPLGLDRRSGTEVRFVADADLEARTVICIAGVPQGELVYLMEGDDASVLDATDAAVAAATTPLGGNEPIALVAFDCIARRGVLGEEGLGDEIERIRGSFPDAPLSGFYTYGEFARTRGPRGFHNQTLVLLALS